MIWVEVMEMEPINVKGARETLKAIKACGATHYRIEAGDLNTLLDANGNALAILRALNGAARGKLAWELVRVESK